MTHAYHPVERTFRPYFQKTSKGVQFYEGGCVFKEEEVKIPEGKIFDERGLTTPEELDILNKAKDIIGEYLPTK